jgi:hypothetical protein
MTRHYAIEQRMTESNASWSYVAGVQGKPSDLDTLVTLWAQSQGATLTPIALQPEWGFRRYQVGSAHFRLVPVKAGQRTL